MEIKGKVVRIIAPSAEGKTIGDTKTGEKWMKHTVVIEYQGGDYPKRLAAMVFSKESANRWKDMGLELMKEYTFALDIDAHEWNGRWFNDLSIWKAEPVADPSAGTAGASLMQNAEQMQKATQMLQQKFPPVQQPVTPEPIAAQQKLPLEGLPF